MINYVLSTIDKKTDYLAMLEAITGAKTNFTEEEKAQLLELYEERSANRFGVTDTALLKSLLILDTAQDKAAPAGSPLADMLDPEDLDRLTVLCGLCRSWEPGPEEASQAKVSAMDSDANTPMKLALARAALDALADQKDITPYREDIEALAKLLKNADESAFSDASAFLIRVRERVR